MANLLASTRCQPEHQGIFGPGLQNISRAGTRIDEVLQLHVLIDFKHHDPKDLAITGTAGAAGQPRWGG